MKTRSVTEEQAERQWWVVDMEGQTLGRAATRIAHVLRGKHKPTYTPHTDTGDFVVVLNADKFVLTGRKRDQKRYHHHTGTIGGLKTTTVTRLQADKPGEVVRKAVAGMLPKNILGRRMLKKLKVYAGGEHPHEAQTPEALDLSTLL
jgi:large subunit ribosomal protein L13